jgi:hypothetical protein
MYKYKFFKEEEILFEFKLMQIFGNLEIFSNQSEDAPLMILFYYGFL